MDCGVESGAKGRRAKQEEGDGITVSGPMWAHGWVERVGWSGVEADLLERATAGEDSAAAGVKAVLVFAHPDDEAIAVGARLRRFADALFVQVTDGAPVDNADGDRVGMAREAYRVAREREVREAFRAGSLPGARHECLRVVDKEAALNLAAITAAVRERLVREEPEVVLTHPYEGGHADHDACAFAVHAAVGQMLASGAVAPVIAEAAFYFKRPEEEFRTGEFLFEAGGPERSYALDAEEQRRKQAMYAAFPTQESVLRLFGTERERFRVAPGYDFTAPPHAGPAHYESFMPEMNAVRFSELARAALAQMAQAVGDRQCR